jgi:DNA-binding NarL/FixJ family response regulator
MRVLLVGSPSDRARLQPRLDDAGIEVVAEFPSVATARASGIDSDAIVMASKAAQGQEESDFAEPLTAREVQVLELLAEGLPNKAIAERLGISDQTVKFHVASISGKLGAANRTDAVRRAVRRGLIAL